MFLTDQPHRKKRHRYEIAENVRFLTWSCFKRLPFFNNEHNDLDMS